MRAYIQLTKAQLRLFARNRQVLGFSLIFPILLMVALGSFLGGGSDVRLSGYLVDEDGSDLSRETAEKLLGEAALGLAAADDASAPLEALRRGDAQLVVVIPEGFGRQVESVKMIEGAESAAGVDGTAGASGAAGVVDVNGASGTVDVAESASIRLFYDEKNMAVSQLGVQYVTGVVDGISKEITGYTPAVAVDAQPVESLGLKYIDFLVPGIVAMMIMSSNINGVAGQIASWRERGVLRRMQSTTLKAGTFIAAQITARLLLNGAQAVIVLLIASLVFGTRVSGSWMLLLFYVVLGTLVFMSIGLIIAGLAKTPESAGPIAGLVSFPLLFLGNVFFPIRNMPELLQPVVKALPITHLSEALRGVMNVGAGIGALWVETLILGAWLVAAFVAASLSFKWE